MPLLDSENVKKEASGKAVYGNRVAGRTRANIQDANANTPSIKRLLTNSAARTMTTNFFGGFNSAYSGIKSVDGPPSPGLRRAPILFWF